MQRILQPGEIEALDRTRPPNIRLPEPKNLFADRAARLRQRAKDNPIGDYLRFIATLVDAQQALVAKTTVTPIERTVIERAQAHSMPLRPAMEHLDPVWHQVLADLLDLLDASDEAPAALRSVLAALRERTAAERDEVALSVLDGALSPEDLAAAPLIAAALQVVFVKQASLLSAADVPYTDPATICPVCASRPVASVQRIGGQEGGLRYLHCGICCTEWHMVRVKCSHCESTKGIHYQGATLEGSKADHEVVLAETCDQCHTYRKLVNQENDPLAEPLADDLASLTLDLLMGETAFARASTNPLLAMLAQPAAGNP